MRHTLLKALIVVSIVIGWVPYFDQIPADYTEYGEMDLVACCISKSLQFEIDPEKFYQTVVRHSGKDSPRVSFQEILNAAPLEIFIRSYAHRAMSDSAPFLIYRLTNLLCLLIGSTYLYWILRRVFTSRKNHLMTFFFVTAFPLITVGRVAGRLGPLLSSFLVAFTVLHLYHYLRKKNKSDLILSGIFTGLSFFNSLHSSVFVIPCIISTLFFYFLFKQYSSQRPLLPLKEPLNILKKPLYFVISAITTNLIAIFATLPLIGLSPRKFLSELCFINTYSKTYVLEKHIQNGHNLDSILEQMKWYLNSHFLTGW